MMRTVSLRRRVVAVGAAVVVLVLGGAEAFVYLSMRDHLLDSLDQLLDTRAEQARAFAPTFTPEELARLAGSEVSVSVRAGDGTDSPEAAGERSAPGGASSITAPSRLSRLVSLPDGSTVELVASRGGMDRTLRRVLVSELVATAIGVGLAIVLLIRASRVALRPIDAVVATARHIKGGRTSERLRPDRTDTELGRMAVAFDEMLDGLEAALAEAQASNEAGKRFLAEAAHQLRTPIAGIQTSIEALPSARDPAEREELLESAARESARAGRRVAALLRMARLDQGAQADRQPVDLVALCREEVERMAVLNSWLAVQVHTQVADVVVEVDPDGIREALANLLDNARRHAVARITVTLSTPGTDVEVRIADDGPGVPATDRERIFERFVSLDGGGGSGLGLAIVRGIARAHGGDIRYQDGAFILRIPRLAPSSPDPEASGGNSQETEARARAGPRRQSAST